MLSAARVVPWASHVYRSGALRSNTTVHASSVRFALLQRRALSTVVDEDRSGGENGEGRDNSSRQRHPSPLLGRGVGLLGILLLGEMTGADVRCAPVAPSDDSKAASWLSRFFGVSPPAISRDADPARAGSSAAPPPPSGAATDAAAAAFDAALSRINVEELGLQVWRCDMLTVMLRVTQSSSCSSHSVVLPAFAPATHSRRCPRPQPLLSAWGLSPCSSCATMA